MKLYKTTEGYFKSTVNKTDILLYLNEQLLPSDDSLEKLQYIAKNFDIHKRIIGLPDLHFKIKNFVPSGMTIPVKNYFSPMLLGPNNDGMGSLRFRIKGSKISSKNLDKIFTKLKSKISMFRRQKDIINNDILDNIFRNGITDMITEWGFKKSDLIKFENNGCNKTFSSDLKIDSFFSNKRPKNLPDFVPGHDIYERGRKCIGVLDGTSHFIELFKVENFVDQNKSDVLNIKGNDYFFLIHAGAGDICLLSHRSYLNANDNKYYLNSEQGNSAFNSFLVSANYGHANRLYIYKVLKEVLEESISGLEEVEIFSDVPHDYLEYEESNNLFIHRKGAAKIFPSSYYPDDHDWNKTGTPYLFPSCVGGDAYIISNKKGNKNTFYTVSHGAGRLIKKDQAIDRYKNSSLEETMKYKIKLFRYGVDQIEGQNPLAFKDMDTILKNFKNFNLADSIVKLKPIASLKA